MKASRGILAALAGVLALCAHAAEPRIGRYVKYDAGDFTIVTSRSADQSRQFMTDLAKFRVTLEKMLGKRATRTVFPTTIVIASASDWNRYLMPRENVAGFFQQGHFVNYMAMNGDAPRTEAVHVVFHEYTHFYLASQFSGEYPPWFNEGLAELMGFAKFTDDGMAVLQIPMYRVYAAREGDWIPFDRLIQVSTNSPEYQSHKLADSFYAQAWLTIHYALVENRQFGGQVMDYLGQLNTLHPQEDAAHTAFGPDLAAIDRQLRDYSRNNHMSSGALTLGEVPPFALPESKPVEPVDALAILADLMLEARFYPERIRPLVESMARREPDAARSAIFAARLAQLDQDDAAFDAAVDKGETLLAPADWLQRRELASVLLASARDFNPLGNRTSAQNERDLNRAMKWFGEAIGHNHEDVEALWGFGTTATQLHKNLELAEQALVAANLRAPGSAEISMSLASLKSHQDKPDEMIPYLKDTIRYAGDLVTRQWAIEMLEHTKKYIAERDRSQAEDRKQREQYEKALTEYEKKYGKTKKKK
jgi:hypothetical protein